MTEWWLFLLCFWLWFGFDSLKISRRPRFLFSGVCRRRARTQHSQTATVIPSPFTWHATTDDPPFSLSPEGISNLPAGSAGRPAPDPVPARAWRWEDIREIKNKRGRLLINGADFCPATPFATAATLRALASRVAPLSTAQRSSLLAAHIGAWFRPAHLRRKKISLLARTRGLAEFGTINLLIALAVTLYLAADGPSLVGTTWASHLVRIAPMLGLYFVGIHLIIVILTWRAHRKLLPAQSEPRLSLVLNTLLLPQLAVRVRAAISSAYFPPQHALAWLAATGSRGDLITFARHTLTDLRWPLPPASVQNPELVASIHRWMQTQISLNAARILKAAGLTETELLAPPAPDSPLSRTYCPRCGDQFIDPQGRCARGPKPLALK
jgi:hypothetical protein